MSTLKNALLLLFRSKILISTMLLLLAFVCWETGSWYGKTVSVTEPLGNAMTLSIYLYIIMMFLSYEYTKKYFNNGVAETILVTPKGKKRKNYIAAFTVMSIYAIIISVIVGAIVIKEYLFYKVVDPNHEYLVHIIENVFLNDFIIMELGIVVGAALAVMKHRVGAYVIMTFFALAISPFASSMAYLIDLSDITQGGNAGKIAFKVISFFYIMPRFDLKWLPMAEFGESLLPYRFFIIGFWTFVFVTFICLTRKRYRKYTAPSLILCIALLMGYLYPSSRMEQKLDSYMNGESDYFYSVADENFVSKDEPADYSITAYDLDLSIRLNLSVTADMKVSDSLDEYKMTLYRNYKVSHVTDQNGNPLNFKQDHDYINIVNQNGNYITNIIVKYKGSSAGCYANYQGCYLPGYYAYYPRAGYIPLYDRTYGCIKAEFLDNETYFKVKVSPEGKYISNLKKVDGIYQGQCDGFTLVKGFYKTKQLEKGNTLVYPYLDNFMVYDGKRSEEECWQEWFDFSEKELEKDRITNSMIFMDAVLDGNELKAYGKHQIFVHAGGSFYYSDN